MVALDGARRGAAHEGARGPVAGSLLYREDRRRPHWLAVVAAGDEPRARGRRTAAGTRRADARPRRVGSPLDATEHET